MSLSIYTSSENESMLSENEDKLENAFKKMFIVLKF